jgi:hypothetical protein
MAVEAGTLQISIKNNLELAAIAAKNIATHSTVMLPKKYKVINARIRNNKNS